MRMQRDFERLRATARQVDQPAQPDQARTTSSRASLIKSQVVRLPSPMRANRECRGLPAGLPTSFLPS